MFEYRIVCDGQKRDKDKVSFYTLVICAAGTTLPVAEATLVSAQLQYPKRRNIRLQSRKPPDGKTYLGSLWQDC